MVWRRGGRGRRAKRRTGEGQASRRRGRGVLGGGEGDESGGGEPARDLSVERGAWAWAAASEWERGNVPAPLYLSVKYHAIIRSNINTRLYIAPNHFSNSRPPRRRRSSSRAAARADSIPCSPALRRRTSTSSRPRSYISLYVPPCTCTPSPRCSCTSPSRPSSPSWTFLYLAS